MLEIDGSYGAGGGQILRTALALGAILRRSFAIRRIRAGRPRPGLMPQHLAAVRAAARFCRARLRGDEIGSTELEFEPGPLDVEDLTVDVAGERGSAGAVTLVAQTVLPIMLFAVRPVTVVLRGGTHVPFSPVYEYLERVLLPFIRGLGYDVLSRINRYGFYPTGGGEIVLQTRPVPVPQPGEVALFRPGRLKGLRIVSAVSRLPAAIAERQRQRLISRLAGLPVQSEVGQVTAGCPGTYIFLEAEYDHIRAGFSALGKKGKPAEAVADEVYEQFREHNRTGCALDPHLADQCLVYLALLNVPFCFTTSRVTDHLQTNIWLLNQFLPDRQIRLQSNPDQTGRVFSGGKADKENI